jgi:hypothetical protein
MGIFLLVVTVVLELAGAAWSYWYGSHVSAGQAGLLNDALGMFPVLQRRHIHVTGVFMGWVALYGFIHLAAVYGHMKSITKKRLKMGRPGQREITVVDRVYQDLATASPASGLGPVSRLAWPRSFDYLPGYDLTLFFLGSRLIIGEGLFTHHSLKPLLAQQLFAYNSGDVWLRVVLNCLPPGELFVAPLGAVLGLPVGIGPVLTVLCWKKHWRDRVYAGDLFAARLGQCFELIQALDQVIRPREQRKNVLLREYPYAAERIDRLMRLAPLGYPGTFPAGVSPPPFGSAPTASSPPPSGTASRDGKDSSEGPAFSKQQAPSESTAFTGNTSSSTSQPRAENVRAPESAFSRWSAFSSSTSTSQPSNQSQKRRKEWDAMQSQPVTLILRFADSGWHVRWRTPSTEAFHAVLEEFKALLDLTERYWDPEAFERGGWWVAYGALGKVGHLFDNYQAVRDGLEREHWQRYEQQRKVARNRAAQSKQKKETGQQTERQNQQPRREEKREEAKLPRTPQEAFRILSLVPPVTLNDVKRAYRAKAFRCHPDRGGSHAQMVVINAAFELAQKAVS